MLDQVRNINTGTIANPYRQFTYTIPAGQIQKIRYDGNVFAVLYTSSENLAVNFSGSGGQTEYWQGIKYHCPFVFTYVELCNLDTVNPLTVTVAIGIGDIQDNRFSVSGAVSICNYNNTPLMTQPQPYSLLSIEQKTFGMAGNLTLTAPAGAKFCRIQNISATDNMTLYDANGFILLPYGSEEIPFAENIKVYGSEDEQFVVAWWG